MVEYIKSVLHTLLGLGLVFALIFLIFLVGMWDFSIFEKARLWNDGSKTFLRILVLVSILLPLMFKIRISIK